MVPELPWREQGMTRGWQLTRQAANYGSWCRNYGWCLLAVSCQTSPHPPLTRLHGTGYGSPVWWPIDKPGVDPDGSPTDMSTGENCSPVPMISSIQTATSEPAPCGDGEAVRTAVPDEYSVRE